MKVKSTYLADCFVIESDIFKDERGYFFESFNQRTFFEKTNTQVIFVQDNESKSRYGVLRGLHMQIGNYAQAKLIRVLRGKILDVVVDVRENSSTFGKYFQIILSEDNKKQLFIPRGFAHGFVVLTKEAKIFYKCDNYFSPKHQAGIIYNDSDLGIDWKIPYSDIILSEKDKNLPTFTQWQNSK